MKSPLLVAAIVVAIVASIHGGVASVAVAPVLEASQTARLAAVVTLILLALGVFALARSRVGSFAAALSALLVVLHPSAADAVSVHDGWQLVVIAGAVALLVSPLSERAWQRRSVQGAMAIAAIVLFALRSSAWGDLGAVLWAPAAAAKLATLCFTPRVLLALGPEQQSDNWVPIGLAWLIAAGWLSWRKPSIHPRWLLFPTLALLAIVLESGSVVRGASLVVFSAACWPLTAALASRWRSGRVLAALFSGVLAVLTLSRAGHLRSDEAVLADAAAGAPLDGGLVVRAANRIRRQDPAKAKALLDGCLTRAPISECYLARGASSNPADANRGADLLAGSSRLNVGPQVWFAIGRELYAQNRHRDARDALARGFLVGDDAEARMLYGDLFAEGDQPHQAILHYERAFELNPEEWQALQRAGRLAHQLKDDFKARQLLIKAAAKGDPRVRIDLVDVCLALGATAEARHNLERVSRLFPDDPRVRELQEKLSGE